MPWRATTKHAKGANRLVIERFCAEVRDQAERDATALDDLVGAFEGTAESPTHLFAEYKRYLRPGGGGPGLDAEAADGSI